MSESQPDESAPVDGWSLAIAVATSWVVTPVCSGNLEALMTMSVRLACSSCPLVVDRGDLLLTYVMESYTLLSMFRPGGCAATSVERAPRTGRHVRPTPCTCAPEQGFVPLVAG
jgi:hypothetical protein